MRLINADDITYTYVKSLDGNKWIVLGVTKSQIDEMPTINPETIRRDNNEFCTLQEDDRDRT